MRNIETIEQQGVTIRDYSLLESADPSEILEFSRPPAKNLIRFDTRTDDALRSAIFDSSSPLERERAAWEYGDRHGTAALAILREAAISDTDPAVRWNTLWLIQKIARNQSQEIISSFLHDGNMEVRDWARLLLSEINGMKSFEPDGRPLKFDSSNPFDQTLPLQIAGYARVLIPGMGWVQATLSPRWFESIMGRVMACTSEATFNNELVIEKRIEAFHPDGSDHYEIFKFQGLSHELAKGITFHNYEGRGSHTFYPSGKVEDSSITPIHDVIVNVNRIAITARITAPELNSRSIVQSVRGRYTGSAYVNLARLLANNMQIGPGEVQLSNLHHPIAGPLTNTWLYGSFKGKLSDLNGDEFLDVNTERCHGTLDGQHDADLDQVPDADPFDPIS